MHGRGGAVSSVREGSFVYTSPILFRQMGFCKGGGPTAVDVLASPQRKWQEGPSGRNGGNEGVEVEKNSPARPWRSGNFPPTASSPSPSPRKSCGFLLTSPQNDHMGLFTSSMSSPATNVNLANTTAAASSFGAWKDHQYNIPLEGAASFHEQVRDMFRRRVALAAPANGSNLLTVKESPCNGLSPFQANGVPSRLVKSQAEWPSHDGFMASKWDMTDRIEHTTRNQALRILRTALYGIPSSAVRQTGFTGNAADDDEIAFVSMSYSFEAELRGWLILEHAEVWLEEDMARRKVYMCEDHARRIMRMEVAKEIHVEKNKRRHAARMREAPSYSAELAKEERDTLLASIQDLEAEEAKLLKSVHRIEQQVKWSQQNLSIQEQETLTGIKMERHEMISQLRQLEVRLEEAIEQRKRAVLDATFGQSEGFLLTSSVPRCRVSQEGEIEEGCGLHRKNRDLTFSRSSATGGLRGRTPGSDPTGMLYAPTANGSMMSYLDGKTSSMDISSLPTLPVASFSHSISLNRDGRGAFSRVMREAMEAATAASTLPHKDYLPQSSH
ncbi:hypothetical protein TcBrA4_0093580 [Trypanosoma cruzi]|nr:hypothetical protein TcBrA4_0093580 [Trypanosoma cruzi]